MADLCQLARNSVTNQFEMFRLAERDHGLSVNLLARKLKLHRNTVQGWKNGAAMPAWALFKLGKDGGIPDELLSLIGEPFERHVGTDETGEDDFDTAADDADELAAEVRRARSPKSPGGIAIVPQEKAKIIPLLRKTAASARRAVG